MERPAKESCTKENFSEILKGISWFTQQNG
jgi:hypothetical protein